MFVLYIECVCIVHTFICTFANNSHSNFSSHYLSLYCFTEKKNWSSRDEIRNVLENTLLSLSLFWSHNIKCLPNQNRWGPNGGAAKKLTKSLLLPAQTRLDHLSINKFHSAMTTIDFGWFFTFDEENREIFTLHNAICDDLFIFAKRHLFKSEGGGVCCKRRGRTRRTAIVVISATNWYRLLHNYYRDEDKLWDLRRFCSSDYFYVVLYEWRNDTF